MNPTLDCYPYELRSRQALNGRDPSAMARGLLLRQDGGHACFQTWESLGDAPISWHLDRWRAGETSPALARVLAAAATDARARHEGRSLFEGLISPENHATVPGEVTPVIAAAWREQGFTTLKVKLGPDWPTKMPGLVEAAAAHPELVWRFDFNESISAREWFVWARALDPGLRSRIDVVEDPCPFSACDWADLEEATGIRLAVDRQVHHPAARSFIPVCKPARDDAPALFDDAVRHRRPTMVTSNMDHPLGIAWAAWWAARFAAAGLLHGPAGLATHLLFPPDPFSDRLGPIGNRLRLPTGTGLGFDDLLQDLAFQPVGPLHGRSPTR